MSRGVIYTATFLDFINGEHVVDVPQGYNRVQINQFTAGTFGNDAWLEKMDQPENVSHTGGSLYVQQKFPISRTHATAPANSYILKAFCEGIDTQSNVVAAAAVGETVYLGMNGNPYKITNRTLKFYITNEANELVNNTAIILQYTFI